jgi:hypothetical protein
MAKQDGSVTETITYVPGQHDPAHVKWGNFTFQANVPKEVTGNPDGTSSEKLNHHIIESARNNPCFVVGKDKPARRDKASAPKNAREYSAYFIDWLKDGHFETAEELIARFAKDRDLQAKCEVGPDDFAYLGTLFNPRLADLAKAEALTEPQVAAIWISHGINQLPW